jgi:hypothetical protein
MHKFENGPTQIGTIGLNRLKDKRHRKSRIYVMLINLYFTNGCHFEWRAGLSRAIVKRDNLSQICIKLIQRFQKRRYSNIIVFKKCLIYKISINLKRELLNIYYSAHFDVNNYDVCRTDDGQLMDAKWLRNPSDLSSKKTIINVICWLTQYLGNNRYFFPNTCVSSTNKTDHHDITELLLKVASNTTATNMTKSIRNNKF